MSDIKKVIIDASGKLDAPLKLYKSKKTSEERLQFIIGISVMVAEGEDPTLGKALAWMVLDYLGVVTVKLSVENVDTQKHN
jgi:hypothetical protein